jgi:integrase/recombinase XerD
MLPVMVNAVAATDEIDHYLETLWLERGLSENTLAAYRRDLTFTAQVLAAQGIDQLTGGADHQFARCARTAA